MNDGKERFCNGCFTLIAPSDPEAFSVGSQWFHSGNCRQKMLDRNYEIYLKQLNREARKEALAA
jgi:hypothetical protein